MNKIKTPTSKKTKTPIKPAAKKASKPATKKGCNCVKAINEKLEVQGLQLEKSIKLDFSTGKAEMLSPLIQVGWINGKKKKKTPYVFCSYCPFCGKPK